MSVLKPLVVLNGQLQQIQTGSTIVGPDGSTAASLFASTDPLYGLGSLSSAGIVAYLGGGSASSLTFTSNGTITIGHANGVGGAPNFDIKQNVVLPGTGSMTVPHGDTAEQPAAGVAQIRYNTDTNELMWSDSSTWRNISSSTGTVTSVGIATSTSGLTVGSTTSNPITTSGNLTVALNSELQSLSQLSTTGLVARTGSATYTPVTITGTAGQIDVSNGNGVGGPPTISIDSGYAGGSSIATLGTVTTGTWNATTIAIAHGGTGATSASTAFNALSPITSTGDLIVGNGVNSATRLGVGSTGQVLTVSGGTAVWAAPATSGTVTSVQITTDTPALTVSSGGSQTITGSGTFALALSTNLQGLSGLGSIGFVYQSGAGLFTNGNIGGSAGRITIGGTPANPTIDLATVSVGSSGTLQKVTVDGYGRVTQANAVVLTDLTTILGTYYLPEAGGTMAGQINMGSNDIINLPVTPGSATAAASKAYVDAATTALNIHAPVEVATTGNLLVTITPGSTDLNGGYGIGANLTSISSGVISIDSYSPALSDRVLVKDQTDERYNGIYFISNVGAISYPWVLTRATDDDDHIAGQVSVGDYVFVRDGTANKNTSWVQTGTGGIIDSEPRIGIDNIIYTQFGGAGTYSAGTGLTLNSGVFSVNYGAGIESLPTGDIGIHLYNQTSSGLILTTDGVTRDTSVSGGPGATASLQLLLKGSGGLTQDTNGLYIPASGVTNAMLSNSSVTIDADSGAGSLALGGSLNLYGTSNRLSTSVTGSTTTFDISASYVGQSSITTLGTISTGTWASSTKIGAAYGGTGIDSSGVTNGQLLIGSAGAWNVASLTAGTGISVTPGAGTLSINNTGVTNVGLTVPSIFTAGSSVTSTGNLSFTLNSEAQNAVFAGPASGSGTPTFRALVAGDIPGLAGSYLANVVVSGGTTGLTGGTATTAGTTITLGGTLVAANGGTGQSSYTIGDILYASGSTTLSKLADVAVGSVLLSGGVGAAPTYGQVNLASAVTGTLPIGNGGTGQTSKAAAFNALSPITSTGDLIVGTGTNTAGNLTVGSNGQVLTVVAGVPTWTSASSSETQFENTNGGAITIGQIVYVKSDGTVGLAKADSASTASAIGLVADASISNLASGNILVGGVLTGLAGLTPGVTYFLSDATAGLLTATAPTASGSYIVNVGIAISSSALKVNIQPTILL